MRKALRNHDEVAHFWAAQAQEEGRAGNMFFDGPDLFSYGWHYIIARIYKREDGARLVLFNSRGYSVSTAKHISIARRAVSHLTAMEAWDHAPQFSRTPDHKENMDFFVQKALSCIGKARRAKRRAISHADGRDIWNSCFLQYADFFRIPEHERPAFPAFDPGELEKFQAKRAAYDAQEEARQERAAAARRLKYQADFDAWKAGQDGRGPFYDFPVALRIKEDRVETSRGAAVPIDQAKRAVAAWKAGTLTPGQDIGPYTLDQANAEGVQIGCHNIPAEEIERLATALEAL